MSTATESSEPRRRQRRLARHTGVRTVGRTLGIATGITSAVVALGVAELIAGTKREWNSPVLDVGDRVIDRVPVFMKDFAIRTFGTKDKPALLVGIGIFLAIYAGIVGVIATRRSRLAGVVGIAAFGVIGAAAALARRSGGTVDATTPSIVGAAVGAGTLWFASGRIRQWCSRRDVSSEDSSDALQSPDEVIASSVAGAGSRRRFIANSVGLLGALTVVGAAAATVGRAIKGRFSAVESRANVVLPEPVKRLAPVPTATTVALDGVALEGVAPFITPNADFYRIDTALTVPQLPTDQYELRIHGMVEREVRLSYDDLLNRDVHEYDITLTCVSNTIGGELIGNARWLGIRLDDLLAEAGVDPSADQVVGRSVDGYTCGFPVEAATDGRNAIVAIAMNGEPLPLEHGFPARLVVPGLYGYISATKWLTEIELTTFERFQSYWVPRGYADRAPIKLMSRIDSIDGLGTLTRSADGVAAIGGVAWAQTRGISAVEVQVDDGPWMPAEMGAALSKDTWRQWAYRWTPTTTGRTSLRCRAIDGDGVEQTADRAEPLPNGASGHHQIIVFVE